MDSRILSSTNAQSTEREEGEWSDEDVFANANGGNNPNANGGNNPNANGGNNANANIGNNLPQRGQASEELATSGMVDVSVVVASDSKPRNIKSSKDNFQRFPLENSFMPEVLKRLSLARQIDKITRKDSQVKAEKSWFDRNASSVELVTENYDSEEEQVNKQKQMKVSSRQLKKLQEELNMLISRPLESKSFSHRYLAGAGVTPLMQEQLQQLARQKLSDHQGSSLGKKGKLVVIGQDCMDALQALRSAGEEVRMNIKDLAGKQRNVETLKRKRKEEKKRSRDQRRKQKKKLKYGDE